MDIYNKQSLLVKEASDLITVIENEANTARSNHSFLVEVKSQI